MKYDFETLIERKGTDCVKYDLAQANHMPEDVLSMWVADMDFKTAPEILQALHQRIDHGIFGYTEAGESYYQSVCSWMKKRFCMEIQPEWIVKTSGVVFAMAAAVQAYTEPGDAVLIQTPVYPPFRNTVENLHREVVENPLRLCGDHYEMDFGDLENKLKTKSIRMMMLCSPHNPVSRVWRKEDLLYVLDLCEQYHVVLFSDEIHSDFVYQGYRHFPILSISEKAKNIAVMATAPSKTFNLAGLQCSNILIANPELRSRYQQVLKEIAYGGPNVLALTACQAAYDKGEAWLTQLLEFLQRQCHTVNQYLTERLPQVKMIRPEGTYLLWLDFRSLGLSEDQLEKLIVQDARLWLDRGNMFGSAGEGFERVNIACPESILSEALERLEKAIKNRL